MADSSRRPTPRQKTALGRTPQAPSTPRGASRPARRAPLATPRTGPVAKPAAAGPRISLPKPKPKPRVAGPAASASSARRPSAPKPSTKPQAASAVPARGSARLGARPARAAAPASGKERRERHQRAGSLRAGLRVLGVLAAVALAGAVAFFALRSSGAFAIQNVEAEPTEHVSAADVANLVKVPEGSTLLNVDTAAVEASLKKNPWVASVAFERVFPSTLRIVITEQKADALVVMSTGSIGWYLGSANVWIQPTKLTPEEGESTTDAALKLAVEQECLLITDVPATVDPEAGAEATDDALEAVRQFREGFSDSFNSQIVCFSAPSASNVSCVLQNGVYVSLGSAANIQDKESIVQKYLEKYGEGKALYLNVRVVSNPAVRQIASNDVQAGGGVLSLLEQEKEKAAEEQQQAQEQGQQQETDGGGDADAGGAETTSGSGSAASN